MDELLAPVRHGSLRDAVLPELRQAIMRGKLAAGARLSESEIARTMGVSRAPVREALAHLEQEGLVRRVPNRGAFVSDVFSRRAVGELASLCNALETFALKLAVPLLTPEICAEFDRILARMQDAIARRDLDAVAAADYDFHRTLVAAAGHQRLLQTWTSLAAQYWALYLPIIQGFGADIENWARNHRAIIAAARDNRLDLALMHLEFNILNSAEHLRLTLPDDAAVPDGADLNGVRPSPPPVPWS